MQQRAALGDGDYRDGAGHVLGAQGGALARVDGNVEARAISGSNLLANEQHRCFVPLALTDHDLAIDRQLSEFPSHGIDGRLVGTDFIAAPAQTRCGYRGPLRHPHDLHAQDAFEQEVRLDDN
jgi:hypothetical protein